MNKSGFTLYKARMDQNEILGVRNEVRQEDVPVEISWDGDYGYLAVPNSYVDDVETHTRGMLEVKSDADEAYLSSWMNIGEPGLARLNGDFDAEKYLEGPDRTVAD